MGDTPLSTVASTLQAPLVGVLVGENTATSRTVTPISASKVAVWVGAVGSTITPKAGVIGTQVVITVQGVGLNDVVAADFVPNTGLVTSNLRASGDGKQLTLTLTIDATAPQTPRLLVLRSTVGPVLFANQQEAQFQVNATPIAAMWQTGETQTIWRIADQCCKASVAFDPFQNQHLLNYPINLHLPSQLY